MRRRTSSLLALVLAMTAVLPGTAVFAYPALAQAPDDCGAVDPEELLLATEAAGMIVIGEVKPVNGGALAEIDPEAFLKGSVSREAIRPKFRELPGCATARLEAGKRILVFLPQEDGVIAWPTAGQVFWLEDGRAIRGSSGGDPPAAPISENELVHDIRVITEQYAVPAASDDEAAGIDWWKTVVPVGAATLGLFAVSLYLMRIWHRIDPS